MNRFRMDRTSRVAAVGATLLFVGCNAIVGIEERELGSDPNLTGDASNEGTAPGADAGVDAAIPCAAGFKQCAGGSLQTCNESGFVQTTACATNVCANAACMPVVQVAAGVAFACARLGDGTVQCWGSNTYGQLGDGTTVAHAKAAPVPALKDVTQIAAGNTHACALLADKTVHCWGRNLWGELGDTTTTMQTTPSNVSIGNVAQIVAGAAHSCARRESGTVACWGDNTFGELGDGTNTAHHGPADVTGLSGIVELGMNGASQHTCARHADGSVACWGHNSNGQLGDGTKTDRSTPVLVPGLTDATQLAMTLEHSCAVRADRTAVCWGDNTDGDLGDNTGTQKSSPVSVGGLSSVSRLAVGNAHSCALAGPANDVYCWGRNADGQNGGALRVRATTPQRITGLSGLDVAAGGPSTYVLQADGSVMAFGDDMFGQLGDGVVTARLAPTPIPGVANATQVAVGGSLAEATFACAVHDGGVVSCWGNNDFGELGDGTTVSRGTPGATVSGLSNVEEVALGGSYACARRSDHTVWCWGANGLSGLLGTGGIADTSTTPVQVSGINTAEQISVGIFHACARLTDGTIACWGDNGGGVLGDGTTTRRTTPVPVLVAPAGAVLGNVAQVSCGGFHTCARLTDGSVKCWGANNLGQIGDDTVAPSRPSPTSVVGLTALEISGGRIHNCARIAGNLLECWGHNAGGGLGDGTYVLKAKPVAVLDLTDSVGMFLGGESTCSLDSTGGVRCWGANGSGQLGDGTMDGRTTANGAASFSNVDKLATSGTGSSQACALMKDKTVACWGFDQTSGRSAPLPVLFK